MKLYIHASTDLNPFDVTTTGTSFYDNFLKPEGLKYMQEDKNLTGEIVMMSPNEYFEKCSISIFKGEGNSDVASLKQQRESSHDENGEKLVKQYEAAMIDGEKFPLCYLDYSDNGQEGLHRMYAAGEAFGWDTKFPVLVVKVFNDERYKQAQLASEAGNFERFRFKGYVSTALDELSDISEPVPPDLDLFCRLVKDYIITLANQAGYKIDLDVEIENANDLEDARILAYLTSFNGYDLPTANGQGDWLSNLFDIGE